MVILIGLRNFFRAKFTTLLRESEPGKTPQGIKDLRL